MVFFFGVRWQYFLSLTTQVGIVQSIKKFKKIFFSQNQISYTQGLIHVYVYFYIYVYFHIFIIVFVFHLFHETIWCSQQKI